MQEVRDQGVHPVAADPCAIGQQRVGSAIGSEKDCIAEFAGLRAVASTEDFIIGPTAKKGFINVAGIQSPGLTSAPAMEFALSNSVWRCL